MDIVNNDTRETDLAEYTPFQDKDIPELEYYIDTKTGECFASQRGLARMCGVSETAIRKWVTANQISAKEAKTLTTTGFKTANLLDENDIYEALAKYNPTLLVSCAKAGLRMYIHLQSGYKFEMTAPPELGGAPVEKAPVILHESYLGLIDKTNEILDLFLERHRWSRNLAAEVRPVLSEMWGTLAPLDTATPLPEYEDEEQLTREYRDIARGLNLSLQHALGMSPSVRIKKEAAKALAPKAAAPRKTRRTRIISEVTTTEVTTKVTAVEAAPTKSTSDSNDYEYFPNGGGRVQSLVFGPTEGSLMESAIYLLKQGISLDD